MVGAMYATVLEFEAGSYFSGSNRRSSVYGWAMRMSTKTTTFTAGTCALLSCLALAACSDHVTGTDGSPDVAAAVATITAEDVMRRIEDLAHDSLDGRDSPSPGLESAARTLQMELEGTGVRATIVRPGPAQTEMGTDWDPELLKELIEEWGRWGILRHMDFMKPEAVADGVVAVLTAPPGVHLDLIQLTPEKTPPS